MAGNLTTATYNKVWPILLMLVIAMGASSCSASHLKQEAAISGNEKNHQSGD